MAYNEVTPVGWTKRAVSEVAETLAAKWKLNPGDRLDAFAARLGGTIEYQNVFAVDGTKDGSILIDDERDFKIFVPDYVSFERKRFTIAHEIGHYILHYVAQGMKNQKVRAARASGPNQERSEREADWFAAALLMPKDEFLRVYREAGDSLIAVARHFGVSKQAAKWQLDYYDAIAKPGG